MRLKDTKQESDKESPNKYPEEMELNEKSLSLIYDTVSDAVFLLAVEPDDRFRFVSVNRAFLDITGLSREQVVGKRIEQVLPETAHGLVIGKYKEAISENNTVFWEEISAHPTGELVGAVTVTPVWNAGGVCTHLVGSVHDLTEIRRAEEALQKSEQMFRILVNDLPSMIFVNRGGKVVYANQTCHDLMGYTVEEFISPDFDFLSLIAPESLELIKDKLSKHMQGKEVASYEYTLLTKDGKRLNVMMTSRLIDYEGKSAILGNITDITERKLVEEALKRSRALLNATGRMAKVGGWELVAETLGVRWTEETYRIHEVPLDYKPPLDEAIKFYHPEDRPKLEHAIQRALEHGAPYDMELRFITAKGKHLWTHSICKPLIVDGKTVKLIGTFQDITEQKRAEEALLQSDIKYRTLVEHIHAITYIAALDESSTTLYVSPQIETILGISPADYKANPDFWVKHLHPDDREQVMDEIRRCHESEQPFILEYRMVSKDGRLVWLSDDAVIVKDDKGQPFHLHGVMYDITERKRVEEELKKLNEELEQRVIERTAKLEEKNEELEHMNKVFVGRELRMAELKKQITYLEKDVGPDIKVGDKTT